ncbi:MAG: hypothetical protein HHJ17_05855 [Rhodoferax sp.]|uniref:hypothetical protein n=1 Tax=Rhodoferax sp. TaxID=50421 RepID=UPI00183D6171|nr:hypothetical protein [Rhodoferax sp.]NMM13055.1 hypothetical protein [Rhodoferax sp.]NMM19333.1 hypothetical protein [Rhodoferax sp.]
MNTTPFVIPGVLAPLQGLWRWLMPTPAQSRMAHEFAISSAAHTSLHARDALQNFSRISVHRPLRIVRILDADQPPSQVGRMVISGRMADVCAELDRLAAREAAFH